MLSALKSVALYLRDTAEIDLDALMLSAPNLAQQWDSTPISSTVGLALWPILDNRTDVAAVTNVGDSPCYFGVTYAYALLIDAVRFWWPTGVTPPTVKLQTFDGTTWTDAGGANSFTLVEGKNVLRLGVSAYAKGVRVVYVSGGTGVQLRCAEFEVYSDLRIEPRPIDWAAGGVFAVHPDLELSSIDVACATVAELPADPESGEVGGGTRIDNLTLAIGIHCASEDQLDRHLRWARSVLDLALAPDRDGNLRSGLPLRGVGYPLTKIAGGNWWTGQQGGWFTSPAPTVTVDGVATIPTTIDYGRGRVEVAGASQLQDVRADFACGVWSFGVTSVQRAVVDTPAALLHRHNAYLVLESEGQFRDAQDALA